jgi:hypothetical protein
LAVANSVFCVIVEVWLNSVGALTWDWKWWSATSPIPIVLFGYLQFPLVSYWVHDMRTIRAKVITVGSIFAFDAVTLVVFGAFLGWL